MNQWLDPSAQISQWTELDSASEELLSALSQLYWEGVTREIALVILSYKTWERCDALPEEEDIYQRLPEGVFHFIEAWGMSSPALWKYRC